MQKDVCTNTDTEYLRYDKIIAKAGEMQLVTVGEHTRSVILYVLVHILGLGGEMGGTG